ncbi:MAG: hypothetical protein ACLSHG_01605 [Oscillospiraceae bacterium]
MEPELQKISYRRTAVRRTARSGCHALPRRGLEHRPDRLTLHGTRYRGAAWATSTGLGCAAAKRRVGPAAGRHMGKARTAGRSARRALYSYTPSPPPTAQTVLKGRPLSPRYFCGAGPATASEGLALEGYVLARPERSARLPPHACAECTAPIGTSPWCTSAPWQRRPETGLPWYRSVADELADYCRTMHHTRSWSFCP